MRINLLPPDIKERAKIRRRTTLVLFGGAGALVLLFLFYLVQQGRLAAVRGDLEAQQDANRQIQARIGELQRFDELLVELDDTRSVAAALLADEVQWSSILRDISLVIPGQTWLTALTGAVEELQAGGAAAEGLVGQISFNGFALTHRDVALWLTRLEDVAGFANPWLSNSQKTSIGTTEVVQFTSSVDISDQALARRLEP